MYRKTQNYLKLAFLFFGLFGCLFCAYLSYIILPRNDLESIGIPVSIGGGFIGILAGVFILRLYARKNIRVRTSLSIDYFRNISFYSDMKDVSDIELFRIINDDHQNEFGKSLDPEDPFFDLFLTSFDKTRVWWNDTEADVCSGNNSYVNFTKEISEISRGSFNPIEISEIWESEDGPIHLNYILNGNPYSINPNFIDDYIDVDILLEINKQIVSTGYRFDQFLPFDQTAFLLVLSKKEKRDLINKRGWRFYPL